MIDWTGILRSVFIEPSDYFTSFGSFAADRIRRVCGLLSDRPGFGAAETIAECGERQLEFSGEILERRLARVLVIAATYGSFECLTLFVGNVYAEPTANPLPLFRRSNTPHIQGHAGRKVTSERVA